MPQVLHRMRSFAAMNNFKRAAAAVSPAHAAAGGAGRAVGSTAVLLGARKGGCDCPKATCLASCAACEAPQAI
jgi:hypothetical protein